MNTVTTATSGRGPLRRRLLAGAVASALVVLAAGLYAVIETQALMREADARSALHRARQHALLELSLDFGRFRNQLSEVAKGSSSAADALEASVTRQGAALAGQVGPGTAADALRRFGALQQRLAERHRSGAQPAVLERTAGEPAGADADAELKSAAAAFAETAEADARQFRARMAWLTSSSFGLIAIALAAGYLMLARALRREVLAPLGELTGYASRLASGLNGEHIERELSAEVGAVVDAFNRASDEVAQRVSSEHFATHDPITELPNRTLLLDRLDQAIRAARRGGGVVGLLVINLDRFRVVNESLGHALGDEVIRLAARRLQRELQTEDTLAGLGGAEFALIVRTHEHPEQLAERAEQLRRSIQAPFALAGQPLALNCTMGIAAFPRDGADAATLLTRAGIALHRAKAEKRQEGFRFYTEQMNAEALERLRLENDLRLALEHDELVLHYQPQVDIHRSGMVGVEALIRWQHPQRGLLGPADFMPVAEECGLVLAIGDFVLREACRQARAWRDAGHPPISMAVNLSARQFLQPDLLRRVSAALEASGLPADALELEITENIAMHDADFVVSTLHALKQLGVRLAIDDFGTGYSSLSYLKRFPIDKLKIDRTFVTDIPRDGDEAIVSAIIAMARSLDLRVIAEGVEAEYQVTYLQAYQCDEAQGYYFGKPVPASDFPWRQGGAPAAS